MKNLFSRLPRFVSNSITTVASQLIPIAIGVVTIPICIHRFDIEKFGLLTLVWTIVGYFAFADLGLGRAIVKLVAERIEKATAIEIPKILGTSSVIVFGMSAVIILGLLLISGPLATSWLKVPLHLEAEATGSLRWLSITVLAVTMLSCVKGFLEGVHDFHFSNFVQVAMGTSNYVVPLIISFFSKSILLTVIVLSLVRWAALIAHWIYAKQTYPQFMSVLTFDPRWIRRLLKFGGWITVGNIVTATRIYMDRFILSATVGLSVLAYYSTPVEVLTRVLVVPGSLIRIIFPMLSQGQAEGGLKLATSFGRSLKLFTYLMWMAVSGFSFLAYWIFKVWISPDFSTQSYELSQILALAFFVNGTGWLAFAALQAIERADVSTKIFIVNFVLFVPALFLSTKYYGLKAAAWTRFAVEGLDVIFLYSALMYFKREFASIIRKFFVFEVFGIVLLLIPQFVASNKIGLNLSLYGLSILIYTYVFVTIMLDSDDRSYLAGIMKTMLQKQDLEQSNLEALAARAEQTTPAKFALNSLPKVTLVIPSYNQEGIIAKAIQSALAQTYKNLEILIVDDASQDKTAEMAREFESDPRVRIITHEKNIGRVANYRKSVYELASGEWIINVDADDYLIDNRFIEDAIYLAQKDPTICLVFGKLKRLDTSTGLAFNHSFKKFAEINSGDHIILSYWKYGEGIPHLTSLYKKKIAIERETRNIDHLFDDTESFFRIIAGHKVGFINRYVGVWTMHPSNSSKTIDMQQRLNTFAMVDSPHAFFQQNQHFTKMQLKTWRTFMLMRMSREHICNFLDHGSRMQAFQFTKLIAHRYSWFIALSPYLSYRVWGRLVSRKTYMFLFRWLRRVK